MKRLREVVGPWGIAALIAFEIAFLVQVYILVRLIV